MSVEGIRCSIGVYYPWSTIPADDRRHAGWSDHYAQSEVLGEGIEIPVVVQQLIPALDASGCNHRIDGLANRYAQPAQCAEILRRLNGDFLPAQLHHHQRSQHFPGVMEIPFVMEALEDLSQNQVTDRQGLMTKEPIEPICLRRDRPFEVIDPHAGIHEDQPSLLIALRSPCQFSFPRSRRISACRANRSRLRS